MGIDLKKLYGGNYNAIEVEKRYNKITLIYEKTFGKDYNLYSSSGRIEILGNHTDHNNGKVLTASISLDTICAANVSNTNVINIKSEGYHDMILDVNDTEFNEKNIGTSLGLVMGVVEGYKRNNLKVGGFNAIISSNVLKGSGVSSSASFEVLIAEILNDLFNDGHVPSVKKAQISQFAENVYFGKPSGLLDQTAIACGGITNIDFEKPKPKITAVDMDFSSYSVIITNTESDHSNLTSCYADIKNEMESVAKFFGEKFLREVSYKAFINKLPALTKKVSGRAVLRAIHFFEENLRVEKATLAIKNNDYKTFFNCMNESGDSSYKLLQNCYAPGDIEQRIPLALEISRCNIKDGATRVHGGGFAGTIIAILKKEEVTNYIKNMALVFGEKNIYNINIRTVGACKIN